MISIIYILSPKISNVNGLQILLSCKNIRISSCAMHPQTQKCGLGYRARTLRDGKNNRQSLPFMPMPKPKPLQPQLHRRQQQRGSGRCSCTQQQRRGSGRSARQQQCFSQHLSLSEWQWHAQSCAQVLRLQPQKQLNKHITHLLTVCKGKVRRLHYRYMRVGSGVLIKTGNRKKLPERFYVDILFM